MARLLLPHGLVRGHVTAWLEENGFPDARHRTNVILPAACRERLRVDSFDASYAMTLYRPQDLGFIPSDAGQFRLAF